MKQWRKKKDVVWQLKNECHQAKNIWNWVPENKGNWIGHPAAGKQMSEKQWERQTSMKVTGKTENYGI